MGMSKKPAPIENKKLKSETIATSVPIKTENSPVFLKCNMQTRSTEPYYDLEGFEFYNGLVSRIYSNTSKVAYIIDTEDFLMLKGRKITSSSTTPEDGSQATPEKEKRRGKSYRRLFRSL